MITLTQPTADLATENEDNALVALGRELDARGYSFTTITPHSHALVNYRHHGALAEDLAGIFGWSRPFRQNLLPSELLTLAYRARVLVADRGLLRSTVRFSTIAGRLVLHSAFPTVSREAVFFGPDTYRFVHLLQRTLGPGEALCELGCGTGAAALCLRGRFMRTVMTDVNPLAVRFARINARIQGIADGLEVVEGDLFAGHDGRFDAIIANPPFMIDPEHRLYRDGGGHLGTALALRIVSESVPRLAPGGRLVLYTGAPIIDGADLFRGMVTGLLGELQVPFTYEELDVDVFGSELANPAYAEIDRIALVAVVVGPV